VWRLVPSRVRLTLVLVSAVLAISCGALFYRLAEAATPDPGRGFGLLAASVRMAIAGLLLGPAGVRAALTERPGRRALTLTLLAGIALALHFATWISSLQYTSVAVSTALVNTNPVWITLLTWIVLRERPRGRVLLGAAVAIAGCSVLALADQDALGRGGASPLLGDGLALAGALAGSGYILLGRAAQRAGMSLTAYAGLAYAVAGLALLPTPYLFGAPYLGHPGTTYLFLALLALVPQLIGHTSVNWAIKHIDPTLVAVILLLEPIGSTVGAALLFDEQPGPATAVGIAILLGGVALAIGRPAGPARLSEGGESTPDS
jgi:drug/metabolite transporter (DMT)-like permease